MASNKVNLRLTWEDPETGKSMEQVFSLPVDIGRDTSNKIVLSVASVSRHHARIELAGDEVIIRDLGSSNGTIVNGKTIDQTLLNDGDMVSIGGTSFSIELTTIRPSKPSMDHLFGALIESEQSPTITLSSLDKKALFADLDESFASKETAVPSPAAATQEFSSVDSTTAEKLSGDELRQFLSKRVQKDMQQDISGDIDVVAGALGKGNPKPSKENSSGLTRFFSRVRRLFGS